MIPAFKHPYDINIGVVFGDFVLIEDSNYYFINIKNMKKYIASTYTFGDVTIVWSSQHPDLHYKDTDVIVEIGDYDAKTAPISEKYTKPEVGVPYIDRYMLYIYETEIDIV